MTYEEMLEQLVSIREHCRSMVPKDEPDSVLVKDVQALDMALSALRTQQEREDPKPLTLDELRQMDGEPVWVVCDVAAEGIIDLLSIWALVEVAEESIFLANNLGGRTEYAADVEFEDDGITVYRHKPKEEAT